jgi:outer membrane protein assembly factor BamB
MFRGGPDHLGVYDSPAPSLAAVAWKFHAPVRFVSSPVVANGTVYIGGSSRAMYAIDAATGKEKWRFATDGPVNSSPAYGDGLVYVASIDGNVYAVDAATSKKKWSFATEGERRFTAPGIHGAIPKTEMMADPFDVFLSSPVIAGGLLYIGSGDHYVYALDAATGILRSKFKTGDVVHASPAVANGMVYIGSWDRNMYALDAATGAERWRYQTGNDTTIYNQIGIASSAAVANGVVYFGCRDGHFYAVDAATGALRWSHDNHMGWVIASPAVTNGVVYFPTSDGTRFKALDAKTGEVRFNVSNKVVSFSSPAIAGTTIYFGTSDGWLHAIDARTGATIADFQTDGSKENSPKYINEKGEFNGTLYTERTLDGLVMGMQRMFALGSVLSSPVVSNGLVIFGSTDGNVYALH